MSLVYLKAHQWHGVGSMLDAILGLLQQSPPSANAPLAKYESLLKDREPRQSLLADDEAETVPMPSMKPIDKMVYF